MMLTLITKIVTGAKTQKKKRKFQIIISVLILNNVHCQCRSSWKAWAERFIPTSMQGLNVML